MLSANGSDKSAHPARFPALPAQFLEKIKAAREEEERVSGSGGVRPDDS